MRTAGIKFCAVLFAAAACWAALPLGARSVPTQCGSVKIAPKPELKPVTVDPKTTALLVLDVMKSNCGVRPRCVPIVPNVKKMIDQARAHNMLIAYNLTGSGKVEDMADPGIAPK